MKKAHFSPQRTTFHVVNVKRKEYDPVVQNGLGITPSQMEELMRQGLAIGSRNAFLMQDVSSPNVGEVPAEFTRHWDMADGYQAMKEVHAKARSAVDGMRSGKLPLHSRLKLQEGE